MAAPYLDPYLAPFKPLSNITPFTHKDGATYLEVLEDLRRYVNNDLVDFINEHFTELGDDFETQVNALILQVNEAIAAVIGDSAETQDAVVQALIQNTESLTRLALDALYADQVTDEAVAAAVVTGDTKTALDSAYAGQVTDTAIDAIVSDTDGDTRETLDNLYAGQVTDSAVNAILAESESESRGTLDGLYADQVTDDAIAAAVVTGDTKTALDSAYAGQVTDAAVAARVVTGDTKSALDAAYAAKGVVDGYLTEQGIIIPAFATEELPDPTEFPDGVIAFDTDEGFIKVTVSGEWTALEGGGGGFDPVDDVGIIAIGNNITPPSSTWPSLTIGNDANNDAPIAVALGDSTIIAGGGSAAGGVVLGYGATLGDTVEPSGMGNGIAIGNGAKAYKSGGGTGSVAIGQGSDADGSNAVVVGSGATADGDSTTVVGYAASATGEGNVALGYGATVTGENSAQIGQGSNSDDDTLQASYDVFRIHDLEVKAIDSGNGWVINGLSVPLMIGGPSDLTPLELGFMHLDSIGGVLVLRTLIDPGTGVWRTGPIQPHTVDGAPPEDERLEVGWCVFDTALGHPIWLKTIDDVDPAENVWVDATGATVYPAP